MSSSKGVHVLLHTPWFFAGNQSSAFFEQNESEIHFVAPATKAKQSQGQNKKFLDALQLHMNFSTTGHGTRWDFLEIANYQRYQKVHVISLKHLQKLCKFWKVEGCGSKTKPAPPIWILEKK